MYPLLTNKKNVLVLVALAFATSLFFISCKKDVNNSNADLPPDLTTKISCTVSGFVTDENNAAVLGATVQAGTATTNTDKFGYFEIKNVQLVKNAAFISVNKAGYFKGTKTYSAVAGKAAFFRIKLIPKNNSGNINSITGGSVSLSNGLTIALPAAAVVNASTNAVYTGTVHVAANWINPAATDLDQIMPGDLRGINDAGLIKGLTTYGMSAVELTGAAGELLQIAAGKKATITFPLPAASLATAPSSIPLWYFDETIGLWKQEGTATKTGNTYVGDVSHFSYWNCDLPNAIVPLTFTVVDVSGNPVGNVYVDVVPTTPNSWSHAGGYLDPSGYVSIFVTPNTQYLLKVYSICGLGTPNYTQTFSVGVTSVDLGNIIVPTATSASVTGTLTDCNNNAVTNGYVIVRNGYQNSRYTVNSTGSFSFTIPLCSGSTNVDLIAGDNTTLQEGNAVTRTLVAGNNAVGNLQACGTFVQQFINYTIDGGATISFSYPADSLYYSSQGTSTLSYISGYRNSTPYSSVYFSLNNNGIGLGSVQALSSFSSSQVMSHVVPASVNVNITEYGTIGQFVSGNFTGAVHTNSIPDTSYNIVCSFRVRRQY